MNEQREESALKAMKSNGAEPRENRMPPDASSLEYYRIVRSQIEHEDNVINQRLNWFVSAQAFLFTANAIVLNSSPTPSFAQSREAERLLILLVPAVAICSCLVIYATVIGGVLALRNLRRSFGGQTDLQGTGCLPPLQGSFLTRSLGLAAPVVLPMVFLVAWTILLLKAVGMTTE
jgi:hypothetical protein